MKTSLRGPLILLCLFAPWSATFATNPAPPAVPVIPASLAVPADQTLALTLTARGFQIYECRPAAGEPAKLEWVLKAPEADLFDAQGRKVGRHSAGPTWELFDGGKVVGRVRAKADAPDRQGVPWLLLEAVQTSGGGIMGRVKSIQRVETMGGTPGPAPDKLVQPAGSEAKVGYTATYKFYVAKP